MKTSTLLLFIGFAVISLCVSPNLHAVIPPPDGGYPGGNTAEGHLALGSLSTGTYNTAVGIYSLLSLTDGSLCTGVGAGTLLANAADSNTATGAGALFSNTTGFQSTATGAFALFSNTEGNLNTAIGAIALVNNVDGNSNTATGAQALQDNSTGSGNTAIGRSALIGNITGDTNTAIGINALQSNTSGNNNIALGAGAGAFLTTGDNNIDIGNLGAATEANTIHIGTQGTHAVTYIAGISDAVITGTPVLVDANGRLGVTVSSQRFKDQITPMDKASEAILALKPVTFRYKKEIDAKRTPQFGLVAEDVEKVNPDLVVHDTEGNPYSVRYDQVNAMLLNEFLKEHKKVEQLEKQIKKITADLQRVSAQLEVTKVRRQIVLNNQ